jgi:general stress protein 26
MSDMSAEHVSKIRELVDGIEIAMLTTVDDAGSLRSRPMAAQEMADDGTLWFFTGKSAPKVHEAQEYPVNVAFSDAKANTYVSVSGTARLVTDSAKIHELWKPQLRAWFPDGVDDPDIALLSVKPTAAEYWDAPARSLVHLFGLAKALVTRQPADPGEHEKVTV